MGQQLRSGFSTSCSQRAHRSILTRGRECAARAERARAREPRKGWVLWREKRAFPREGRSHRRTPADRKLSTAGRCPAESGRGGTGGRDPETPAGGPCRRQASFPRGRTRKRAAGSAGAARAAGASRGRGGWGGGVAVLSLPGHAPGRGGGDCAVHRPPLRTELRAGGGRVLRQGPGSGVPSSGTPSHCWTRRGQDHSRPFLGHRPHVVDESQCLGVEPRNVKVGGGTLAPSRLSWGGGGWTRSPFSSLWTRGVKPPSPSPSGMSPSPSALRSPACRLPSPGESCCPAHVSDSLSSLGVTLWTSGPGSPQPESPFLWLGGRPAHSSP